ncbi:hypothetical protein EW145_g8596, partial [Phellinidium pouzarii]
MRWTFRQPLSASLVDPADPSSVHNAPDKMASDPRPAPRHTLCECIFNRRAIPTIAAEHTDAGTCAPKSRVRVSILIAMPGPPRRRHESSEEMDFNFMLGISEPSPNASASSRFSIRPEQVQTEAAAAAMAGSATTSNMQNFIFGFVFFAVFVAFLSGAFAWQRGANARSQLQRRQQRRAAMDMLCARPRIWDVYVRGGNGWRESVAGRE